MVTVVVSQVGGTGAASTGAVQESKAQSSWVIHW
jgi:hypothetical protein